MPAVKEKAKTTFALPPEAMIAACAAARKLVRKGPPLAIPVTLPDYEGDTWEAQVDWQRKIVRLYHSKKNFDREGREQIVYEIDPVDLLGVEVAAVRL